MAAGIDEHLLSVSTRGRDSIIGLRLIRTTDHFQFSQKFHGASERSLPTIHIELR